MSYAYTCRAQAGSILNEKLNGIRDRSWLRWFFLLPIAFFGSVAAGHFAYIYSLSVAGWAYDDWVEIKGPPELALPRLSSYFVEAYTWVVLAGIIAPRWKKTIAVISFPLFFGLFAWLLEPGGGGGGARSYWLYVVMGEMGGGDYLNPLWLGGIVPALILLFRCVQPRMMLTLPAYYFGFFVPRIAVELIVPLIFRQLHLDGRIYTDVYDAVLNSAGGFGAVGMAALMSQSDRVRTSVIFVALTLVYVANTVSFWLTFPGYPTSGMPWYVAVEPGLLGGAFLALGWIIFRCRRAPVALHFADYELPGLSN
jgi:hypothetical protein